MLQQKLGKIQLLPDEDNFVFLFEELGQFPTMTLKTKDVYGSMRPRTHCSRTVWATDIPLS